MCIQFKAQARLFRESIQLAFMQYIPRIVSKWTFQFADLDIITVFSIMI